MATNFNTVSVGTSASLIYTAPTGRGGIPVVLKAFESNTGNVFVSNLSTVTIANAGGGFVLEPGRSVYVEAAYFESDGNVLYAISDTASQRLSIMGKAAA